jgi:sulfide:quinone oxidoreductase
MKIERQLLRVLVAGGGVAALEAALALHELAPDRVDVELLAPEPKFWYRPLAVVEPFGAAQLHGLDLVDVASGCGARFTLGALAAVDVAAHVARTDGGAEIPYDVLLLACGAQPVPALAGALTFRGPADTDAVREVLAELESGAVHDVVFAAPGGVTWPLPLYELALLTATFAAEHGLAHARIALVTPEESPLALFGAQASAAVAQLLRERGVAVHTRRFPMMARAGGLDVSPSATIPADRVVALPRLRGRPIEGIAADANGFVPTDLYGRVAGASGVFAAGDVTSFGVKQGGIAAQQATAAAETIAATAGADIRPRPFRPVLRGLLLTGSAPAFLRAEVAGGRATRSTARAEPLWWPPGKVVGRRLAPFLAEHAGTILGPPPGAAGVAVEIDFASAWARDP